jgi:hypothetical protein
MEQIGEELLSENQVTPLQKAALLLGTHLSLEHRKLLRGGKELFGFKEGEDRDFMENYLKYLAQLKFEDIAHWTAE